MNIDGGHADPDLPPRRKRRRKGGARRRRRRSPGLFAQAGALLKTNRQFLLFRAIPVVAVVVAFIGLAIANANSRKTAKLREQLTHRLWSQVRGAPLERDEQPTVRGDVAILETQSTVEFDLQDPGHPQHWINEFIETPLENSSAIGSVILVEWHVFADIARDASGRAMAVNRPFGGPAGEPAMLKRWRCHVKLVDLKGRVAVYEARLEPADRRFREGQRVLTTPSTRVSDEQLAAEFERILRFPRIALNDE